MYSIDDPSKATTLPAPEAANTEGFFTEGNPALGVPAARVRASWLNMIQGELRNIVIAAGLTPSKTTYNQVLTAIQMLVGGGHIVEVLFITATQTYARSAGATGGSLVLAQGGGGSGYGCPATGAAQGSIGGGGGGGAICCSWLPAGLPNGTVLTMGAGGAAVTNGGTNGGATSVGALMTAPGGLMGTGNGPVALPSVTGGGASGGGSGGNLFNGTGRSGGVSSVLATGAGVGGEGGGSAFSGGGAQTPLNANGTAAGGYGAGGGGTANGASQGARAGGAGGGGAVLIINFS